MHCYKMPIIIHIITHQEQEQTDYLWQNNKFNKASCRGNRRGKKQTSFSLFPCLQSLNLSLAISPPFIIQCNSPKIFTTFLHNFNILLNVIKERSVTIIYYFVNKGFKFQDSTELSTSNVSIENDEKLRRQELLHYNKNQDLMKKK